MCGSTIYGIRGVRTTLSNIHQDGKIIKRCHETQRTGLKFVQQDRGSLRLAVFTDAFFATTAKLKSQIGIVRVLVDKNGTANMLRYSSSASNSVARSVMPSELLALVYGFDYGYIIQNMI